MTMSLSRDDNMYVAKLLEVARQIQDWRTRNPNRPFKIQFNFPETVHVAGQLTVALEQHFIAADEAGLDLLHFLGLGTEDECTVFMLRMALEHPEELGL